MKIVAHTIVGNEENFVWYAINSVIDYVDQMIIWDTGSSDKTPEIILQIQKLKGKDKIIFKKKGKQDPAGVSNLRQQMMEKTKSDWVLILDGDEIWWKDGIEELRDRIYEFGNTKDLIVSPNYMLIGDIFHYQEERAGKYKIGDRYGHFNIRAIRNFPSIHVEGIYPNEAYVDDKGVKIQDLAEERIYFSDYPYLHASFLTRSRKHKKKLKYEIGEEFAADFYYPEVFFKEKPERVPDIWEPMNFDYKIRAYLETPFKKLKRRLI